MSKATVAVGRRPVEVSSPEKVLFPDDGITKADLVEYNRQIAKHMLPHLADRPIAMERYPDGLAGQRLFQKNVPRYFPEWISRVRVSKQRGSLQHVLVDQPATLVYLANQACITVHAFLSKTDRLHHPDQLMFDLDPPGNEFQLACRIALDLRRLLEEELRLPTFVKTSGGDGLHVVVPLDRSEDFDAVRSFAREVGRLLARRDPDHVTVEQRKQKRGKRLFVDVNAERVRTDCRVALRGAGEEERAGGDAAGLGRGARPEAAGGPVHRAHDFRPPGAKTRPVEAHGPQGPLAVGRAGTI